MRKYFNYTPYLNNISKQLNLPEKNVISLLVRLGHQEAGDRYQILNNAMIEDLIYLFHNLGLQNMERVVSDLKDLLQRQLDYSIKFDKCTSPIETENIVPM
jgi:hypothetical protein